MSAGKVAEILKASGLPQKVLRQVWSDAKSMAEEKSSPGTMNKAEFDSACTMAAAAGGVFA
jgi:hypothetical protein